MNTPFLVEIKAKLLADQAWCESVIDYMADHATMDSQSNYSYGLAQRKLPVVVRNLQRIELGTYDRCDRCGDEIEHERLETLADSDTHVCARCARAAQAPVKRQPVKGHARVSYRYAGSGAF